MHAPSSPIEPTASVPASAGDVDARHVRAVTHDEVDEIDEIGVDDIELDGVVAVEALSRWLEARSMHPAFASRR